MKAHSSVNLSTENETGLSDYITAHFFSVIHETVLATLPDSLLGMQILSSHSTSAAAAKFRQLCPTLCDPIDGSPPGSLVPGILQARTLEWVAISFSNARKESKFVFLMRFPGFLM